MLPVQPGMAQFVRKDVSAARDGKPLADIDGSGFIVPDPVRIPVALIHFQISELPHGDAIPEGQDHP